MADKELVRFEKVDGIGVITVDNPPVNALSPGVPEGIVAAVDKGNAEQRPLPRIRDRNDKLAEGTPALFEAARKAIARRARNQRAPYACIEAVEAASTLPFDEGCALERKLFDEQVNTAEARALRYAFFAEREVAKLPHIPSDTKLRPTDNPAVIGAGTMGGGIAMSFADNGFDVKITDATQEALDRGIARIRSNYETSVKRGSLAAAEMEKRLARIHPVAGYDDIADCDVVIEAAFEQIPVKEEIFKKLDAAMKPGALLYSNTSGIDIDIMANATKRPQDVAGTHFFAPANVMKLFEVVKGAKSAPDALV